MAFGKDTALTSNRMQLDSVVALIAELVGRDLQLGIDLVDDRAGTAGTLVIHRGDLLFASTGLVLFEDNDLGILSAKFDHRVHFWM